MRNIAVQGLVQPIHRKVIDLSKPLFIVAFGDVHKGCDNHAEHDWRKFCAYYREFVKDNQCLFVGMGDYLESFSTRERAALSNPDIHESTIDKLDKWGAVAVQELYDDISFMEGHCIGLIEGNHRWEFSDGTTSTMRLCNKLKCRYLAGCLYGKVQLVDKGGKIRHSIDVYAAHSTGWTATIGGSIMKLERFAGGVRSNIYILGHDHQQVVANVPLMQLAYSADGQSLKVQEYPRCVVRSGSFMRIYVENSKSYALDKLYKPAGIGNAYVEVAFSSTNKDIYYTLNPSLRSY